MPQYSDASIPVLTDVVMEWRDGELPVGLPSNAAESRDDGRADASDAALRSGGDAVDALAPDGGLRFSDDGPAGFPSAADMLVAELQTRLAADVFALTETLMRGAFAEMEANLLEQISTKLRQALPELIDSVLREHLDAQSQAES